MKNNTDFIYLLRFIAALLVVLKHYSPIRNVFINNGGEAVSFFFLLSGFILVVAYEKQIVQKTLSAPLFYVKRIARVYPLYLFALILALGFHFFVKNSNTHVPLKLSFELFMLQTWVFPGAINYPDWSVSCEFFFYLLFPVYILKLKEITLSKSILLAFFLLISALSFSYLLENYTHPALRPDLKEGYLMYHPILRFPVFFWGNVLGLMYLKNIKITTLQNVMLLLLGCSCIYLWTLKPVEMGLSFKQLGFVFIYTALIVVLLQNETFSMTYLSNPLFHLLGDISYGVYLLQYPVSSFVLMFVPNFETIPYFLLYIIVLLALSYWTFQYLEKPLRSKIVAFYSNYYVK